jgi:hypothetical protein
VWRVTPCIDEVRDAAPRTWDIVSKNLQYIDYGTYAKFRGKIVMAEE